MPILDIADRDLSPPAERAWVHVQAVMLYPDDKKRRHEAEASLTAGRAAELFDALTPEVQALAPPEVVGTLFNMHRGALPAREINARVPRLFGYGVLAGFFLAIALDSDRAMKLAHIKEIVADKARVSKAQVQTQWDRYRITAHLWAACIQGMQHPVLRFPCHLDDLAPFLLRAEGFRRRGEARRQRQSPNGTLLVPGEAWRVAQSLKFPAAFLPSPSY